MIVGDKDAGFLVQAFDSSRGARRPGRTGPTIAGVFV
jgi:hypothetical protein